MNPAFNDHILVLDESDKSCPTIYINKTKRQTIECGYVLEDPQFKKVVELAKLNLHDTLRSVLQQNNKNVGFFIGIAKNPMTEEIKEKLATQNIIAPQEAAQ
jgi:hypothetical protein